MFHTVIHHNNNDVVCYGELLDDSNFHVLCEDEYYDEIWCEGNPETDMPFESWEDVVKILSTKFASPIVEISSC